MHQYSQAEKILTALRPPSPGRAASSSAARRLTDSSLACRYLAAQCQVRLGKWDEALEMVGRNGGLGGEPEGEGEGEGQGDGGIKVSLGVTWLGGVEGGEVADLLAPRFAADGVDCAPARFNSLASRRE